MVKHVFQQQELTPCNSTAGCAQLVGLGAGARKRRRERGGGKRTFYVNFQDGDVLVS
jgi:hypothetical protein